MDEQAYVRKAAFRYMAHSRLPWWERLLDWWFAPKAFEGTGLYERLGVRLIKRYAPTGGDFVIRRYGIRIADVQGNLDSLMKYEHLTRRLEAIHELAFLGFLMWSLWRAFKRRTTFLDLGVALVVYLSLILSPAMLQRYNRLRVYPLIRRMALRSMQSKRDQAG